MARNTGKLALITLVAVASLASALAGDGRIPVHQAGLIDAPGHYFLTRDISGDIDIDADNVVLDLNGRKLSGGAFPIEVFNGSKNVTVRNGRISGTNGVRVVPGADRSADIVLLDLGIEVTGNSAVTMDDVDSGEVSRCRIKGGSVRASGDGQTLSFRAVDNVIVDPGSRGFDFYFLGGGSIVGNQVSGLSGVGAAGIFLASSGPGGNLVADNVVRDHAPSTVTGAILVSSPGNTVRGNTVETSTAVGIYVTGSHNRISDNQVGAAAAEGIYISGDNNDVSGNTSLNNGTGLFFSVGAVGNVYDGNRSCSNTTDLDDQGSNTAGSMNVICVP